MIARMFGSGVIVATAFIHLMDPAYSAIGPQSCVGSTGNWGIYSWCPAIMLSSAVFTFIVDAYCDFFADVWYGIHDHIGLEQRYALDARESAHAHTHCDTEDLAPRKSIAMIKRSILTVRSSPWRRRELITTHNSPDF